MEQYAQFVEQGKTAKAAEASRQLLNLRYKGVIRPGQPMALTEPESIGKSPTGDYLAQVKWYPGSKSLRAVLQVRNPHYTPERWNRSTQSCWVEFSVCASGSEQDLRRFSVEHRPNGKAVVMCYEGMERFSISTGKWKSFDGGYVVDVELPYDDIPGFDKSWTRMAVSSRVRAFCAECPNGNIVPAAASGVDELARHYRVLTRK